MTGKKETRTYFGADVPVVGADRVYRATQDDDEDRVYVKESARLGVIAYAGLLHGRPNFSNLDIEELDERAWGALSRVLDTGTGPIYFAGLKGDSFFYGYIRATVFDHARQMKRLAQYRKTHTSHEVASAAAELAADEFATEATLVARIRALPEEQIWVVLSHLYFGQSFEILEQLTGISRDVLRARFDAARRALRDDGGVEG